jgi:Flp pilus assembly protein CpaB
MALWVRRRPGRLLLGQAAPWWRRSPSRVGRWALALGLATSAAAGVAGATGRATDAMAGWGATRSVLVARRDLEPGRALTGEDVERRDLPDAVVPASAVDGDPTGRVVTSPIAAGEVVSRQRLAPAGVAGVAALVGPDQRAVAVPTEGTGLRLRVGDRVDVYPSGRTDIVGTSASRSDRSTALATDAVVVDVADTAVTVAVARDQVAAVAGALGESPPVLALVGGS